jgi:hypothetical protein
VKDVRLWEQARERLPLHGLLAQEARLRALQVPVGLIGAERLRVEDDEPRVHAASPQRLHVRPADPGQVDRAVRHAEGHLKASLATPPQDAGLRPGIRLTSAVGTIGFNRTASRFTKQECDAIPA